MVYKLLGKKVYWDTEWVYGKTGKKYVEFYIISII